MTTYLSDGVHLYEKLAWQENHGLAGGGWLTVRDCLTLRVRVLGVLEQALCEPIQGPSE